MITHNIQFPDDVHPDSLLLCSEIAKKMAAKMLANQTKYGWTNEWKESGLNWMDQCRIELLQHLQKGDPLDVLIYCAFLVHFDEPTVLVGDVMVSSEILGWYVGIVNKLTGRINDWIEVHADQKRLVRELDELWNGQGNAAPQASLCGIVCQIANYRGRLKMALDAPIDAETDRINKLEAALKNLIEATNPLIPKDQKKLNRARAAGLELLNPTDGHSDDA